MIKRFKDFLNEGNAFTKALADAKEKGLDTFTVDGKEYKVKNDSKKKDEKKEDEKKDEKIEEGTKNSADKFLSDIEISKKRRVVDLTGKENKVNTTKADYLKAKMKSKESLKTIEKDGNKPEKLSKIGRVKRFDKTGDEKRVTLRKGRKVQAK